MPSTATATSNTPVREVSRATRQIGRLAVGGAIALNLGAVLSCSPDLAPDPVARSTASDTTAASSGGAPTSLTLEDGDSNAVIASSPESAVAAEATAGSANSSAIGQTGETNDASAEPAGTVTSEPAGDPDPGGGSGSDSRETLRLEWAVVLAGASTPGDPLLDAAASEVAPLGHEPEITNCDRGAAEAVGMKPTETYTISLHFRTEEEATEAFAELEALGIPAVVVLVEASCRS